MSKFDPTPLRNIHRDDGYFTIYPKAVRDSVPSLCAVCMRHECMDRWITERMEVDGVRASISHCKKYVAPLAFVDLVGTSAKEFSTFRMNTGRVRQLRVGDTVAVCNKDFEVQHYAKVVKKSTGKPSAVIKRHCGTNHLMLDGEERTNAEKEKMMAKIVKGFYGNFMNKESKLVALVLKGVREC